MCVCVCVCVCAGGLTEKIFSQYVKLYFHFLTNTFLGHEKKISCEITHLFSSAWNFDVVGIRPFKFRPIRTSYELIKSPMSIKLLKKGRGVNLNYQLVNVGICHDC